MYFSVFHLDLMGVSLPAAQPSDQNGFKIVVA
jgi:hypothetical protein